jgi:hypothetical protein
LSANGGVAYALRLCIAPSLFGTDDRRPDGGCQATRQQAENAANESATLDRSTPTVFAAAMRAVRRAGRQQLFATAAENHRRANL